MYSFLFYNNNIEKFIQNILNTKKIVKTRSINFTRDRNFEYILWTINSQFGYKNVIISHFPKRIKHEIHNFMIINARSIKTTFTLYITFILYTTHWIWIFNWKFSTSNYFFHIFTITRLIQCNKLQLSTYAFLLSTADVGNFC